ncbi:hypothetical protein LEP1GSC052_2583 [Leptospira kmetyi serovar Malaysia str. Bejo-Iso9]|nr:hypothetical protein LEP1GSC052_2583 [Leptospira kmetyi serovar Malaysia str. Bejo-Iso9]
MEIPRSLEYNVYLKKQVFPQIPFKRIKFKRKSNSIVV